MQENTEFPNYDQDGIVVRRSLKTDTFILKDEDCREVYYSHGFTPDEAIKNSLDKSLVSFTVLIDDKPEIIFGINPVSVLGNTAIIWMLSSERISDINIRFARYCKRYVSWFFTFYPLLFNYVSVDNRKSKIWLTKLGAKFEEPKNYGLHNKPFMRFEFKR